MEVYFYPTTSVIYAAVIKLARRKWKQEINKNEKSCIRHRLSNTCQRDYVLYYSRALYMPAMANPGLHLD